MNTIAAALILSVSILWSARYMTQALTDALARLSTEVTETTTNVAALLREIAAGSQEDATIASINDAADKLDALQSSISGAIGGATEPAPGGEQTDPGAAGSDSISG